MKKVEVLLVDDHQMFRDGLKAILEDEHDIEVKYEASNAEECLSIVKKNTPDIILMDINMPELDGIECTRLALSHNPNLNILALTMHDDGKTIREIIEAEAKGYVIKDAGKSVLTEAIRTVHAGGSYFPESVMKKVVVSLRSKNVATTIRLTHREKQILRLICEEHTTQEIAEILHLSNNTVETHRKNLLGKTGCKNSVGLMRFAIENSLI